MSPKKTGLWLSKMKCRGTKKRTPKTGPTNAKRVSQILLFRATSANVFWPTWNPWPTGARPDLSRSSPSRPVCARGPTVADGGKRKKTDAVARHAFPPNLIISISTYLIRSRQPSVSRISCVSGAHAHTKLRRKHHVSALRRWPMSEHDAAILVFFKKPHVHGAMHAQNTDFETHRVSCRVLG